MEVGENGNINFHEICYMKKKALITGITGQDGSYLAELLLEKGYEVHGIRRSSSQVNTNRINHLYREPQINNNSFKLHYGDLTDTSCVTRIINELEPEEIYNLAAQSHVAISFEMPEYSENVDGIGTLRLLEAIRILKLQTKTKFYQASTSELFGKAVETPQKETTPFYPRSPYAVAKLYSYWITVNYREAYGIFGCNGILFNHESPVRGETFVTRKITRGLTRIFLGLQDCLYLGNLDAKRDWGHAKDYVEMQWLMLQQDKPEDYVIATGQQYSVKDFINITSEKLGIDIKWHGKGVKQVGVHKEKEIIKVNPDYFRPTEADSLLGDSTKAMKNLGWKPKISFENLVSEMVEEDLILAKKEKQ